MKKFFAINLLIIGIINFCTPAYCQKIHKVNVKSGTSISLIIPTYKTSKDTMAGELIPAVIYKDVIIDNVKVFQKGDTAFLNVASVKKAGLMGNCGTIKIIGGTVNDINGESRKVRFFYTAAGEEKAYPKILLGLSLIILWPLAFTGLVKGEEANLYRMSPLDAFVDEDFIFIR